MNIPVPSEEEIKEYEEALSNVRTSQEAKVKAREAGKQLEDEYNFKIDSMKTTNKQMFILFAMNGCPSCTVLKHLIKYNPDVIKALEPYETLIVNVGEVDTHLVKKMNVYSYPGYFIVDKDEKAIKKNYGCNALGDPVLPLVNFINMTVG